MFRGGQFHFSMSSVFDDFLIDGSGNTFIFGRLLNVSFVSQIMKRQDHERFGLDCSLDQDATEWTQ